MKAAYTLLFIFLIQTTQAQYGENVYHNNKSVDIPLIAVGTAWSLYCFTRIYNKGDSKEDIIRMLDKKNVWSINRWAIYPYSENLNRATWVPFLAAIPLPFVFFGLNKNMSNDYHELAYLYWESAAVAGLFSASGTFFIDKYRPYAYHEDTPMKQRVYEGSKNSFFAGHVVVVAVSSFLCAKIYDDYNPGSNNKWIYYGSASALTAFTAYGRLKGGLHFPTDILIGAAVGIGAGILVPHFHKIQQ